MKASDYVEKYKEDPVGYAKTVNDMIMEIGEIAKQRNALYDPAFLSIISEQDKKWRKYVRLMEGKTGTITLNPDGFLICIVDFMPDLGRYFPKHVEMLKEMKKARKSSESDIQP